MLKQSLEQKLSLKLSPRQIQLMKLLQVPTLALEQRIKEELELNPALEEMENAPDGDEQNKEKDTAESEDENDMYGDMPSAVGENAKDNERDTEDFDFNDYIDEDDIATYKLRDNNYRAKEDEYERPVSFRAGLHEHLMQQLGFLPLNSEQKKIGECIIGNIDDTGYLQRSVSAMVNDLAFTQGITCDEKEVKSVLKQIQQLDPPGIGALDLKECLLLQLQTMQEEGIWAELSEKEKKLLKSAIKVITLTYTEFTKMQYEKIGERLKISGAELKEILDFIKKLNPKPGSAFSENTHEAPTIIPDYFVFLIDGQLEVSLNDKNSPELRVNPQYSSMMEYYVKEAPQNRQNKEATLFIKQKIDSARWFMELLVQRRQTLLNIMRAIVDYQREYFISGEIKDIKPMRLKDIQEVTGMDISTISRVTANKYVQTHFGTFCLKEFFSQSMTNHKGEEISTSEVKDAIARIIEKEDKDKPFNDDALVDELKAKGFKVARRTVAKYREQLGLPVARLRREL